MTYAANTTVPVTRSKQHIEKMILKLGATKYASGFENDRATILFEWKHRRIRFEVTIPMSVDPRDRAKNEKQERVLWRGLWLVIKAKIEAVEQGVETFEEAFLAQIVLPSGDTFGEWAIPKIEDAYKGKPLPPLLGR